MTRVSSHELKKEAQEKLFSEFADYIGRASTKSAPGFLDALLTPTEKMMLAKRIGVILLLHNDVSTYQIMEKLHMSSATVIRMHKAYRNGTYESITKHFPINKKEVMRFMNTLEVVLRGGLPSRAGKRWQLLDKTLGRTKRAG